MFTYRIDIATDISPSEPQTSTTVTVGKDSKRQPALTNILRIGQIVLFDAICVIDTAASAVSKCSNTSQKEVDNKSSQVNTNIEVKKVIYMIATKVTKIDDCKMGGMDGDIIGMNFYTAPQIIVYFTITTFLNH